MKKLQIIMFLLIISFSFISCKKSSDQEAVSISTPVPTRPTAPSPTSEPSVNGKDNQISEESSDTNTENINDNAPSDYFYDISEASYFKNDIIKVYYPQLIHLTYSSSTESTTSKADKEHQDDINELIRQAAMRYTEDFDTTQSGNVLENDYIIRWKGSRLLSLQFIGYKNATTIAYPSTFSYTLNIDLNTGKAITLSELFRTEESLLAAIRDKGSCSYLYFDNNRKLTEDSSFTQADTLKTIRDYVFGTDFPSAIKAADTENAYVYSYFTEDSLGISIDTVHALGDHIQFEVKYSEILNDRKMDHSIWADFTKAAADSESTTSNHEESKDQDSFPLDENLIWKNINYVPGFSVIRDQSFQVDFENWGEVYFVAANGEGEFALNSLYLYLADKNSNILYEFPAFYGNGSLFTSLAAVSFQDVNSDDLKDVVIVANYMTGIGPTGAEEFPVADVYFQTKDGFESLPDVSDTINSSGRNNSINEVSDYVKGLNIKLD